MIFKIVLAIMIAISFPAFAAEPIAESTDDPVWVGTVLGSGGKIKRPVLCQNRGGVAHHQAYSMGGRPLERRRNSEGIYWVGKNENVVVFWNRGTYYSAQNRHSLVVAWCKTKRPPRDNTVIIEKDGGWHWSDGNGPNSDPTP